MITILSSPKPGSGVSTTAALLALAVHHDAHTHVVDLRGDQTALLGVTTQPGPTIDVTHHLTVHDLTNEPLADQAARVARLARLDEHVIIDAGTPDHPIHDHLPGWTVRRWVLRPCFLALRRATTHPARPDEVIVLDELGRALTARDVEAVLGVPVTATVEVHPQIARATDAGLLVGKAPGVVLAALQQLAHTQEAA